MTLFSNSAHKSASKLANLSIVFLIAICLILLPGCSSQYPGSQIPKASIGEWSAEALVVKVGNSSSSKEKTVKLSENASLTDMYGSTTLWLSDNGQFVYFNSATYFGTFESFNDSDSEFLLTADTVDYLGTAYEIDPDDSVVFLADLSSDNELRLTKYNQLMETTDWDWPPIVFSKTSDNGTSNFSRPTNIEGPYEPPASDSNGKEGGASTTTPDSPSHTETSTGYAGILETYTKKMQEATPRLVQEYKSEAAGISDITKLAELSNEKTSELAKICSEGVSEMATLMQENQDSYSTYESWAGKLQDVYMEQASQIQDAYMDSAR
ncbi:MAG: hypothetical protein U0M72_05240 [Eggerthellaceae bacterium]